VLALTPPIPGHAWTVPYTAMLDNRILDLSRAFSTPLRAQTTLAGDSHILNITIGDPSRKRAGLYKDVITILIVPN
jgi:hypothetical protein